MLRNEPGYTPLNKLLQHHIEAKLEEEEKEKENRALYNPEDEEATPPESSGVTDLSAASIEESTNYSPNKADFSNVTSGTDHSEDNEGWNNEGEAEERSAEDTGIYLGKNVPSDFDDYYNESALTAKARKELPLEAFGLPRLRAYPLTDEKHVRQAIRMFSHCRDPKDRKTLAKNIFAKVNEFGMTVKIGKDNALYEYAPETLQESTVSVTNDLVVPKEEISMTNRSREQIIQEHLRKNGLYYNNVFFNTDFAKSVAALDQFEFFKYFFPDFKRHTLYSRISCALGGLGRCKELYKNLGLRHPLETDFTQILYWQFQPKSENFELEVMQYSNPSVNWFKADTCGDLDHVFYCLRLYSVLGAIMNDPNFDIKHLDVNYIGLLTDWLQRVVYHYDLMLEATFDGKDYLKHCQYLFDLCWAFCDNPLDEFDASANVLAMIRQMASSDVLVTTMNESGELVGKEECAAYLVHELGLDDDIFLLPDTMEYPILNQGSIRLAMDYIGKVPEENRKTYVANLNRKYREFGCTFSITIDHPYAKYADQNIVEHMVRVLMEGETAVSDDTSNDSDTVTQPWFKRFTEIEYPTTEFYPDREIGPNKKGGPKDWTRTEAIK